jgi:hypothetical protein
MKHKYKVTIYLLITIIAVFLSGRACDVLMFDRCFWGAYSSGHMIGSATGTIICSIVTCFYLIPLKKS